MSATSLVARRAFTFRATVRNQGDTQAAATTLQSYRSDESTLSTIDAATDESSEQFYVYITDASSKHPNSRTPNDYLDHATGMIWDND